VELSWAGLAQSSLVYETGSAQWRRTSTSCSSSSSSSSAGSRSSSCRLVLFRRSTVYVYSAGLLLIREVF